MPEGHLALVKQVLPNFEGEFDSYFFVEILKCRQHTILTTSALNCRGDTWVLICTDLVARGVDFKAVNLVINYDLPSDGVTYVHRIGRTGRAGRQGRAITFFTESDFDNLRTIANVMRLSGCDVPEWMLQLKRQSKNSGGHEKKRDIIDTTPVYDKKRMKRRKRFIENSKQKKADCKQK